MRSPSPESSSPEKFAYIGLTRTAAMFLVMLCHNLLFFGENPYWPVRADAPDAAASFLYDFLECATVPVFVFCSGFLFQARGRHEELGVGAVVRKRAKRLLIPYALYGVLWLVPAYTLCDVAAYGRPAGTSLAAGYASMLSGVFCDVAWFLPMLFWVTLVWIFARRLLRKDLLPLGALAAVAFWLAAHFLLAAVPWYSLSQIDAYIPTFFAGAAFRAFADALDRVPGPALAAVGTCGLAACATFAPGAPENFWAKSALVVAIPVFATTLATGLCRAKTLYARLAETRAYRWLLKHGMEIYLMQAPAMYLGFRLFYPLVGNNVAACVALGFAFTVAVDFALVLLLFRARAALAPSEKKI